MDRLERLAGALRSANGEQNLVAASTLDIVWTRHIADSAQLLDHVPRETRGPWLDLGSGAGFPGLVISIMRPDLEVRLVESRRLRIQWLGAMIETLRCSSTRVIDQDLRKVATDPAKVISARAFAPLPRLVELSARFSTSETHWVLPKGRSATQDVDSLPENWRSLFHVERSQTDPDAGIVVGRGKPEIRT